MRAFDVQLADGRVLRALGRHAIREGVYAGRIDREARVRHDEGRWERIGGYREFAAIFRVLGEELGSLQGSRKLAGTLPPGEPAPSPRTDPPVAPPSSSMPSLSMPSLSMPSLSMPSLAEPSPSAPDVGGDGALGASAPPPSAPVPPSMSPFLDPGARAPRTDAPLDAWSGGGAPLPQGAGPAGASGPGGSTPSARAPAARLPDGRVPILTPASEEPRGASPTLLGVAVLVILGGLAYLWSGGVSP